MKKRFLIPLLLIGAPIAIGVSDAAVHMAGCSAGHQGACAELERRRQHSAELDAKSAAKASDHDACLANVAQLNEYQPGLGDKSYDCEGVKNWVSAAELARTAEQKGLVRQCEDSLRPALKDPASYRYVSHSLAVSGDRDVTVQLRYAATNGFGGRIQDSASCTYTL